MKAEIIAIGTEITSGFHADTNSQWLAQRLGELGIPVGYLTVVADDLQDNLSAFRIAGQRAQLVLITGGLGPTLDDLTRDALARLAGAELILHEESWQHIRELFARRNRPCPERNQVQAMIPEGAEVLPNPLGTAPGIWMRWGGAVFAAMPGVPSEMRAMFEQEVRPRLQSMGVASGVRIQRKINTFGMGESQIEGKLADLTRRGHVPEVGITASDGTISLRIFVQARDQEEARAIWEPVERTIRHRLGHLVFGVDDEELQDAVMHLLKERRQTVATAESVTAGLVSHRLSQVPGASACLLGGIVCYDSRIKMDELGVPANIIQEHTAVSAEAARHLAIGIRRRFRSDWGLSVVGYAGPDAGPDGKPVGTTFVAVAGEHGTNVSHFQWPGTRREIQSRMAKMALNALRLRLLNADGNP
jgi:nicotinamide-nucleotide amidase